MPRPKNYSDELRERAVRLVFESRRPIAHGARDLGIHKEALRLWVRQAEADAGTRNDRLTTEARERIRRNAATHGGRLEYRASFAQWQAELMARRPKTAKLVADDRRREYVQDRLAGQVRRPDGTWVPGPATDP
jgi:hypothetical protein